MNRTWKKLLSWISLLCITLSLTVCNTMAQSNQHVWLLLYEAGETFSLLPLVDALQNQKGYSPEIIAFGPAVNLVREHGIEPIRDNLRR